MGPTEVPIPTVEFIARAQGLFLWLSRAAATWLRKIGVTELAGVFAVLCMLITSG